jgi:alpha,alpha-trehalase
MNENRHSPSIIIGKQLGCIIILCGLLISCKNSQYHFIYLDKEYPSLFHDVQTNKVFRDDKTFADCEPKSAGWVINSKYRVWKLFHNKSELKGFVLANFNLPSLYLKGFSSNNNIIKHLKAISSVLLVNSEKQTNNSSLIPLPNDFIIPGGRFREAYYWDTYFTLLGYAKLNQRDIVYKVTENMAYLIDNFGFVPNGNRSYYLSRSQPPFFSLIVELNAKLFSDSMYIHFLPALEKEYQFWMNSMVKNTIYEHIVKLNDSITLNRYYDNLNQPRIEMYNEDIKTYNINKTRINDIANFYRNIRSTAESGWDFSSRWFANDTSISSIMTLDILPVDLNCLLYHLEKTLSKAYLMKDDKKSLLYSQLLNKREKHINRFFWNDAAGFYFDYNFKEKKSTEKYTLAGIFPLFIGIADSLQANKVIVNIRKLFLKPGGVVTSLTNSGQQWDYPNGWAPLQWVTIQSLRKYYYYGLADTIKNRWLRVNDNCFNKTHKMLEKYNVVDTIYAPRDGEYPTQDGFGWTNGVYLDLKLN